MTKYNAIENEIRESYKEKGKNIRFYIHHGYMASWADEYKKSLTGALKNTPPTIDGVSTRPEKSAVKRP